MTEIVPPDVLASVKTARLYLMDGQFMLADSGFECLLLNDINSDVVELLSDWAGRGRPPEPEAWDPRRAWNPCDPSSPMVPDWIARAAVEWCADRDRRRRR